MIGDAGVVGLAEKNTEKGFRSAFRGYLDRNGGCRTFRYMFKERSALLACGTYLMPQVSVVLQTA